MRAGECALLPGAAAVICEGQLRQDEAVLGLDLDEAERDVGAGLTHGPGRGRDLAVGLHEPDHDLVDVGGPVGGLARDAQPPGTDVAREGGLGRAVLAERAQVRRADERGAGERAALAEPERVEQRRDELAVLAGAADLGLEGLQRAARFDQQIRGQPGREGVGGSSAVGWSTTSAPVNPTTRQGTASSPRSS